MDDDLNANSTPRQIFDKFFDDEMIQLMVDQTNLYASQSPRQNPSRHMKGWVDVDAEEIRKWLGLRIYFGLVPRNEMRTYWADSTLGDAVVKRVMSRDRFDAIKAHLHYSDNESPQVQIDR